MNIKLAAAILLLPVCCAIASVRAAEPNTLTPKQKAAGWQLLFDGKTLEGWKASDQPGTFSVQDGAILVHGPRSHLYYLGDVGHHEFRNFELELEVMTFPQANSGVYFHTQWQDSGWPKKGYEVQVNNSHSDPSRTGGLWGVQDYYEVPAKDLVWFTLYIKVAGKHVTTRVDGKPVADYVEEPHPQRKPGLEERLLGSGTFALQGHDPGSETHFRSIKVRPLP
jgi:3-keto-disaccharide hydrolase